MTRETSRWALTPHSTYRCVTRHLNSCFSPDGSSDHERAQGVRAYWTLHLSRQEVSLRWRDRDRYRSNIGLEGQLYYTSHRRSRLLRGCHGQWPSSPARFTRPHPICYTLPAFVRSAAFARDDDRAQLCRTEFAEYRCFVRPGGCCCVDGTYCRVQGRD